MRLSTYPTASFWRRGSSLDSLAAVAQVVGELGDPPAELDRQLADPLDAL
jgi:hypothetical protein